jgi:hypothetical protein
MAQHKPGLHKDVSTIFDGVWDPQKDNLGQSVGSPAGAAVTYANPKAIALEQWPKEPKSATLLKVFLEAPAHLFSFRSRREKKRLLSISKHLIINLPS